jgi:hypothetical protein
MGVERLPTVLIRRSLSVGKKLTSAKRRFDLGEVAHESRVEAGKGRSYEAIS